MFATNLINLEGNQFPWIDRAMMGIKCTYTYAGLIKSMRSYTRIMYSLTCLMAQKILNDNPLQRYD